MQTPFGIMVSGLFCGRSDNTILWKGKAGVDKEKDGTVLLAFRRGIQRLLMLRYFISVVNFNLKHSLCLLVSLCL